MKECRPVEVSNAAFSFCKYTIALSLWASLIFQNRILVIICFIVLVLSAVLKIQRAPLVALYTLTIDKLHSSKKVILDENAMRFAHTVGAVFSGLALLFLYFIHPVVGWCLVVLLAILKTSASFGYCGAAKLYTCLNNPNGQCCRVGKKVKKYRCG